MITNTIEPAPSQDFILSHLTKPIDLTEISPELRHRELHRRIEQAEANHKRNIETLAAAKKAAELGLTAKRQNLTQDGFIGLLAASTGINHLIDRVLEKQQRQIDDRHAAAFRAANTTYDNELSALQTAYRDIVDRITRQIDNLSEQQERNRMQSQRDIQKTTLEEIQARMREARRRSARRNTRRGYGYRRPSGPRKPEDPDNDNDN